MIDRLTCCPHCGTTFRITRDQLRTAGGAVRCGSCLRIFKALDHLVETAASGEFDVDDLDLSSLDEPVPTHGDNSERRDTRLKPTVQAGDNLYVGFRDVSLGELLVDNSINLDQLDAELDIEFDSLRGDGPSHQIWSRVELPASAARSDNERERETGIEDTQRMDLGNPNDAFQLRGQFGEHPGALFDRQLRGLHSHSEHHTDESWAINLLEEMKFEGNPASAQAEENQNCDTNPAEHAIVGQFYTDPERYDATNPNLSYVNLVAVYAALEKRNAGNSREHETVITHITAEFDQIGLPEPLPHYDSNSGQTGTAVTGEPPLAPPVQPETASPQAFELLRQIAAEPIKMVKPVVRQPGRQPHWRVFCVLACLALAMQLVWLRFDTISQTQPWRKGLEAVCTVLGCSLQPQHAPERISASNLVVRTHPRVKEALIIDSVLLNTAGFEQLFPDFILSFYDLGGNLLAQRRFTPAEYLKGELEGARVMPSGQPVHISLEIEDPGENAINYTASIPLR